MNAINSFFINSSLVLSFFLITFSVKAHDQIDYAFNIVEADPLAFYDEMVDQDFEEPCVEVLEEETVSPTLNITPPKTRQMYGRESITFILGKDANPLNPILDEAFFYFANHPYDQTEFIITSCRNLLDVRNYLATYPTGNALPWSTINIVLSPNEEPKDLIVPIFPQGTKSTIKNLEMVALENDFPSLSSNQIDQYTTLYIHGAEVAKDSKLNNALEGLLFAKENIAISPVFLNDSFAIEMGE